MLSLSINQGWATIKVDFPYNFVEDTLVEDIYLDLQYYFDSDTCEYRANMDMKIYNSLYGMVQFPHVLI